MPKRSSITITKSRVDALRPGQVLWDAGLPGFGVVANEHSTSFKLKCYIGRRQVMLTVGLYGPMTVDQARKKAMEWKAQVNAGLDPRVASKAVGTTVANLCDQYLKKHAEVNKKTGSVSGDRAMIRNHVIPLLGKRAVADVTTDDVEQFKLDVQSGKTAPADRKAVQKQQRGGMPVTGGKGVANRCLALLSKMFNLAETWGHRPKGSNPVRGVTKFKENPKERYLTDAELKRLWAVLGELADNADKGLHYVAAFFRLLLLTGARRDEIRTLQWSMVDLEAGKLTLPDSKTGAKVIQLSEAAVSELASLKRVVDNPYVIVGGRDGKPLHNAQKPWQAIRTKASIPDARIHDLRHTYASKAVQDGVDAFTLMDLLGHSNIATTQRYAHLADAHKKAAAEQLGKAIRAAVEPANE